MRHILINLSQIERITNHPYGKKDEYVTVIFVSPRNKNDITMSIADFDTIKTQYPMGKINGLVFAEVDGNGVYKLI